jgi:hypothetical protein
VTRPHFGIVLVILGTILLAFAVKVRSSRELIVHIVGSSIVATEATISDDPAVAAMGRPRTPCSGLGASVVNIVDNAPATPCSLPPSPGYSSTTGGATINIIRQGESLMR